MDHLKRDMHVLKRQVHLLVTNPIEIKYSGTFLKLLTSNNCRTDGEQPSYFPP